MKNKTKEELIKELTGLHKKNAEYEALLEAQNKKFDRLKERINSFNNLLNEAKDAMYIRDYEGKYLDVNQAMLEIFGYTAEEIKDLHVVDLYADKNDLAIFQDTIRKKGYVKDYELKMRRKNGNEIYCMATSTILYSPEGEIRGYQGVIREITKHKIAEAENQRLMKELHSISFIDDLTGLYNRRGFFSLAQKQLETAKRLKKRIFIIFIDMDNMKWINDTLGHREGDRALIEAAKILKTTYREADVIARMGGDEFAIVAMEYGDRSDSGIYLRLINNLEIYNNEAGREYKLSMSFGMTHYDHDSNSTVDELLSRADTLMYENKKRKRYADPMPAAK
ncbi:MAG: diguanylate cyclase [Spirochaetes bacterium]|nr:diguanylate cyclase [Spirochaetota bacterium]